MKISFESKGDFDVVRSWLKDVSTRNPSMAINQIASEGTRSLASNTPRDTGETASGWVAEVKMGANVSEISWKNTAHPEAGVNIAKLIELGHGTGTGGYVAPKPFIKKAMDPVWKNAGDRVVRELIK